MCVCAPCNPRGLSFTYLVALANVTQAALKLPRSLLLMGTLFDSKDLLFTLVLKVGWAASLAALLVRPEHTRTG